MARRFLLEDVLQRSLRGTPEIIMCPITQDIMLDPVSAADGHAYERAAIAEWLRLAVERWPRAAFYAKTEDDTYVNLRTLHLELRRLRPLHAAPASAAPPHNVRVAQS